MQSLLELQNVSKSYRRGKETVPVLENLSLSLFAGISPFAAKRS